MMATSLTITQCEAPAILALCNVAGRDNAVNRVNAMVFLASEMHSSCKTHNEAVDQALNDERRKHASALLFEQKRNEAIDQALNDERREHASALLFEQKRNRELLDVCKEKDAALQLLRDEQQSNFVSAKRGRRGEEQLFALMDEWNTTLNLGMKVEDVHSIKQSGDIWLTRSSDAKLLIIDNKNCIADSKLRTVNTSDGVEKLKRDVLALTQQGRDVAEAMIIANARISKGDGLPISEYECIEVGGPLGVPVHCVANCGVNACTPWDWHTRLLTVVVSFAKGGNTQTERSLCDDLETRNRAAVAALQACDARLTSQLKEKKKEIKGLEAQQEHLRATIAKIALC